MIGNRNLFYVVALAGVLCAASLWALSLINTNVTAQTCPSVGVTGFAAWPQGTTAPTVVTVYIDPAWTDTNQINAIKQAFTNWQSANGLTGNNCGVTFTYTSTLGTGTYRITVMREAPYIAGARGQVVNFVVNGLGRMTSATINIDPGVTVTGALTKVMAHEIGHTFGLNHCTGTCNNTSTVMAPFNPAYGFNDTTWGRTDPSGCDNSLIQSSFCPAPTPTPTPTPAGSQCYSRQEYCFANPDDEVCGEPQPDTRTCMPSPVVVDVAGDGISLTDAAGGVNFDLDSGGHIAERVAWTTAASDDAWLALDRNSDGVINNGAELFGNYTSQPPSATPNGFLALAEYDKRANGGNGDGRIDIQDTIFYALRLWQDVNHDGVSEPPELHTLPELGLKSIDLDYKESKRTDEYGNQFRYRAKVWDEKGAQARRWAWDVFLISGQ